MCLSCYAIINENDLVKAFEQDNYLQVQSDTSQNFYTVDESTISQLHEIVDSNKGICTFLLDVCPDLPRESFLDFGAGRGCLASAATSFFDRSYAAEINLKTLEACHPHLPNADRISITADYTEIEESFDAIASFHVLEHLPQMGKIVGEVVQRLRPNGAFFFQVPLLRSDYLVETHYTFMNELCARRLCSDVGLEVVGVWFDLDLDFLSCIARRTTA